MLTPEFLVSEIKPQTNYYTFNYQNTNNLLPPESGESVGYSITVLLSIVVFLTITSNSLPGTSEPRMPTIFLLLTVTSVV
jgi:hypothetical protein